MSSFWDDERFIQTSAVNRGEFIRGSCSENTGLKMKHVKRVISVLGEKVD